jgi:hypothetical protein
VAERFRQRGAASRQPPRSGRAPAARKEVGNATANVLTMAGVVGLVVLGTHGREFDLQQATYASREDCLNDWGSEESCSTPTAGNNQRPVYFGPRYYWDPDRGKPVVIAPDGSERVAVNARIGPSGSRFGATSFAGSFARGGFGGIGRGISAGHGG